MNIHIIYLLSTAVGGHSMCSPVYGHEPCSFLPAPPGKTPPCARPGLTYCEYPDHYPSQLIHYLIQKWRFDHTTYLSNESKDDFSSYFFPTPAPEYGPPNYQPYGTNLINQPDGYSPEPIFIPKPPYPLNYQGENNMYIPPKFPSAQNFTGGFGGYPDRSNLVYQEQVRNGQLYTYKYPQNFPQVNRPEYTGYYYDPQQRQSFNEYNDRIWRRKVENKYGRLKRSLKFKRSQQLLDENFESITSNTTMMHQIKKRQAALTGEPMCRTRSQYIMPRAALNNKGNWMYVVNMPELDNRYTQLVKSETCASQACSGICSLPQGYTSRCEQKYVQKRLVALEGGGNQLYTDVFWFPSCCVCTLSNS